MPTTSSSRLPNTGMTHWHQLKAVAKRSHAASRPHSRATSNDSTGGASSAQSVASRSDSAVQAAAAQQHQHAAHQGKRDQRREAGEKRLARGAELAQAVGASARQTHDAHHDAAKPGTLAACPAAHARNAARMPR